MKARIIKFPMCLMYGLNAEEQQKISDIVSEIGAEPKIITDADLSKSVSEMTGFGAVECEDTDDDYYKDFSFAVFSGLDDRHLNNALNYVGKVTTEKTLVQAIVTHTSKSWSVKKLLTQVSHEETEMNQD